MENSPEILSDISLLAAVTVGGTAGIVAFLQLAMFSRYSKLIIIQIRFVVGIVCALIYLGLALGFSLTGPIIVLISALLAELLQLALLHALKLSRGPFRPWVLYVVWLYIWLTALIGWRYRWLGMLTITLPALLIASLGLFFVAGFMLPFPRQELYRRQRPTPDAGGIPTFNQEIQDFLDALRYAQNGHALKKYIEQHRRALQCLLSFALGTNRPYYVVIDEKISERTGGAPTWLTETEKLIQRASGDIFGEFLAGPGIILTGCDHAAAISTGQKFKGVRGPGVIFTEYAEMPAPVIDLRVQLCAFPVEAWTKDGIAVKVTAFIPFQIDTHKQKPALGRGFPYRSSGVFKSVRAQLVEHVGPSESPEELDERKWYDLPCLEGERILREIIADYEFDDLYAPFEPHMQAAQDHPRSKIVTEMAKRLDKALPDYGIQRIGCGIGNLIPVDERVTRRRIEAWRVDWASKIMLKRAMGQSERLRLVEQARAQAQVDLILSVGTRLEQLRVSGSDAIARHFIDVLRELSERSALRKLLPGDTSDVLQRASRGIKGKPEQ